MIKTCAIGLTGGKDKDMKEYRVDVFNGGSHTKHFFDTEADARTFGNSQKNKIVFLLKYLIDDKYDVLEVLDN